MASQSVLIALIISGITLSAPLILAALGGFFSERSGVINIALEGAMLTSACVVAVVSTKTHNPWLGTAAGIGASILYGILHWVLTQIYRIDHVISGMALNLLAMGGTNYLNTTAIDQSAVGETPHLPRIAFHLGSQTVYVTAFIVLAYLLPILVKLYAKATKGGLRLYAVGSDPDKARLAGISPLFIRFWAQVATGVLTGLAGAMIEDGAGRFSNDMTAGRGYIALAALVISGWRPLAALGFCVFFGFLDSLQIALQGVKIHGYEAPVQLWQAAPYVLTIVALAGFVGKIRPPLGLGKT